MNPVTAEIMAEIDRRAQEEYDIPAYVLMENAGRKVAEVIISDSIEKKEISIIILSGKGNNGGDGFVAGRYLCNAGFKNVEIFTLLEEEIKYGAAKDHFNKINNSGIKISALSDFNRIKLNQKKYTVVDALFGTGFKGVLRSEYMTICEKVNSSGTLVYAVDIPSGLNSTTGSASNGCVIASKTITFGLPKTGFYCGDGPKVCGEVIVADIGFPKELLLEYS